MSSAPGSPPADAMRAEFDTVARWTVDVVQALGPDHAVPAGCRGSGTPPGLAWLCEALDLQPGTLLLDSGAGTGGPAAFAAERYGATPVLVDPMPGACAAARELFGLPAVTAWSQQLPFRRATFPAAWCLGVLSTTTEKAALLAELRRVLVPHGRLGLLALVQDQPLPEHPEGNAFPSPDELERLLADAGFLVVEHVDAATLPHAPVTWQARADRVEDALAERHAGDPAWEAAAEQSAVLGRLLAGGQLRTVLLHAVAT